jgi:hypothetical protein
MSCLVGPTNNKPACPGPESLGRHKSETEQEIYT